VNYLQRSFQVSFALHALVVLLLIFMGDRFISSEKILVIDFTLDDTGRTDSARDSARVKTQKQERNAQQRQINRTEPEAAEPPALSAPQASPSLTLNSEESQTVEIQMPATHSETTAPSATGEQDKQDSAGKGITRVSSAPIAAGDMNEAPGRGSDKTGDARRMRYLKANFSYIKDLINRHITYPKMARQMGWQGKVVISFVISSDGHAKAIEIVESSGIGSLDKNAVEAVKRASPFPKPPIAAQLIIPIRYQLN